MQRPLDVNAVTPQESARPTLHMERAAIRAARARGCRCTTVHARTNIQAERIQLVHANQDCPAIDDQGMYLTT